MTTTRARRPALVRPTHPARAAGEAARAAENATDAPTAAADDEPRGDAAGDPVGDRAEQRLRSGRPSYAGRAATVYFASAADRERARNAFRVAGGGEGYDSESEWWTDLIAAGVADLEQRHNDGQPFPDRKRRGRRT